MSSDLSSLFSRTVDTNGWPVPLRATHEEMLLIQVIMRRKFPLLCVPTNLTPGNIEVLWACDFNSKLSVLASLMKISVEQLRSFVAMVEANWTLKPNDKRAGQGTTDILAKLALAGMVGEDDLCKIANHLNVSCYATGRLIYRQDPYFYGVLSEALKYFPGIARYYVWEFPEAPVDAYIKLAGFIESF